ncbi:hypothetical protein C7M84_023226 [Penaeus vannamei]|uniref:Uncharacterized protein n=1 Tax=Penaeus vannamei TaxID=6689 RepID=A0A423U4G1_PENVA|nr:hypothetical protein C7M84_023226 [Penaeus vannamei]
MGWGIEGATRPRCSAPRGRGKGFDGRLPSFLSWRNPPARGRLPLARPLAGSRRNLPKPPAPAIDSAGQQVLAERRSTVAAISYLTSTTTRMISSVNVIFICASVDPRVSAKPVGVRARAWVRRSGWSCRENQRCPAACLRRQRSAGRWLMLARSEYKPSPARREDSAHGDYGKCVRKALVSRDKRSPVCEATRRPCGYSDLHIACSSPHRILDRARRTVSLQCSRGRGAVSLPSARQPTGFAAAEKGRDCRASVVVSTAGSRSDLPTGVDCGRPSLSRFPSQGVAEESERRRERAHMLVGGLADRPQDPERRRRRGGGFTHARRAGLGDACILSPSPPLLSCLPPVTCFIRTPSLPLLPSLPLPPLPPPPCRLAPPTPCSLPLLYPPFFPLISPFFVNALTPSSFRPPTFSFPRGRDRGDGRAASGPSWPLGPLGVNARRCTNPAAGRRGRSVHTRCVSQRAQCLYLLKNSSSLRCPHEATSGCRLPPPSPRAVQVPPLVLPLPLPPPTSSALIRPALPACSSPGSPARGRAVPGTTTRTPSGSHGCSG